MKVPIVQISMLWGLAISAPLATAGECATEVVTNDYQKPFMSEIRDATFTTARQAVWNDHFERPLDAYCIQNMRVFSFRGLSGQAYWQLSTRKDRCDGGNTLGLVLNEWDEVVAEIRDGQYLCPLN